jgi:general secretion pathway protein G
MVVVVIIGVLAGAATLSSRHFLDKAKRNRASTDIATYVAGLNAYYASEGAYPSNDQGLSALSPTYVDKLRPDPWGRPYQYVQPGRAAAFEVMSLGADGREGGDGADADLSSEDVEAVKK